MERLGCSITDCPGFFASPWDTKVAIEQITRADAAIYLLGEKQISEGDKKTIKEIAIYNKDLISKFTFLVNDRGKVTKDSIEETENHLKTLISNHNISNLNTKTERANNLLYFIGTFGNSILDEKLDEFTKERFIEVAAKTGYIDDEDDSIDPESLDIKELWIEIINEIGSSKRYKSLREIDTLSSETIQQCFDHSLAPQVIEKIEKIVISHRAKSILISGGIKEIRNSLQRIQARLKGNEERARKTLLECEKEHKNKINALNDFKNKTDNILNSLRSSDALDKVAANAIDEIFLNTQKIDFISNKITLELDSAIGFDTKWTALKQVAAGKMGSSESSENNRKKLEEEIDPIIRSALGNYFKCSVSSWITSLYNGEHRDYNAYIIPALTTAIYRIEQEWRNTIAHTPSLDSVEINAPNIDDSLESINFQLDTDNMGEIIGNQAIDDIVKSCIKLITDMIIGIIIVTILDLFLTGGLAMALGALIIFWKKIRENNIDPTEKKQYKQLYEKINQQLTINLLNNKGIITNALKKVPEEIINGFIAYYKHNLKITENKLKSEIEDRRNQEKQANDNLAAIAQEAKKLRETKIEPLISDLNSYAQTFKAINS